jgi:hypothetical protein
MAAMAIMDFLLRILRLIRRSENPVTLASVFHLFVGAMGGEDHAGSGSMGGWLGKNRAPGWRAALASSEGLERGRVHGGVAVWSPCTGVAGLQPQCSSRLAKPGVGFPTPHAHWRHRERLSGSGGS